MPPHGACRQPTTDQRIFAVVLKVAAAQGVPFDVEAGPEYDVDPECASFTTHGFADIVYEFFVPAVRQCCCWRKTGCGLTAGETHVIGAAELCAQTVRAVGQHGAGQAVCSQRTRAPKVGPG